jgi:hypothetical protein
MNRKLHNTVLALLASSALVVVSLLANAPGRPAPLAAATAVAADSAGFAAMPLPSRPPVRRNRQSVAMPYFSFVPRG